jgi:hypothetical protein
MTTGQESVREQVDGYIAGSISPPPRAGSGSAGKSPARDRAVRSPA